MKSCRERHATADTFQRSLVLIYVSIRRQYSSQKDARIGGHWGGYYRCATEICLQVTKKAECAAHCCADEKTALFNPTFLHFGAGSSIWARRGGSNVQKQPSLLKKLYRHSHSYKSPRMHAHTYIYTECIYICMCIHNTVVKTIINIFWDWKDKTDMFRLVDTLPFPLLHPPRLIVVTSTNEMTNDSLRDFKPHVQT